MAQNTLATGMFTPTRELPLWINRTKVATVSELTMVGSEKRPLTVKTEQPIVLPLPSGGTYTLPPGGIIIGKYFESCKGWKLLAPLFVATDRSKIHDPLNLLSTMGVEEADAGWMSSSPTGEKKCYGKSLVQWRDYFRAAKDEQVSQEYGKRKVLGRISEFCGVAFTENAPFKESVNALRTWAMA
jgi:hypothetical protein